MTKFGRVEIEEEVFRLGRAGSELRPFKISAGIECRSYSGPLQRVMVDFGAEKSFAQASQRIKEHYQIEVAESAVRRVTLAHAGALQQRQADARSGVLPPQGGAAVVIGELDGSFVPLVEPRAAASRAPGRKRELKWEEARLALAREAASCTPHYGATLGNVAQAGAVLADCVRQAGASAQTHLHCLGDGAAWIAQQVAAQFGAQATFLLDFYHVAEYLGAAAQQIAPGAAKTWLATQKERLLENRVEAVLAALTPYQEPSERADEEAPVRVCLRYLNNHRAFLNYQAARQAALPIGSGEVESGHRSVIQARLKLPGAWWLRENAEKMIALRVARANHDWQPYWLGLRQAVG